MGAMTAEPGPPHCLAHLRRAHASPVRMPRLDDRSSPRAASRRAIALATKDTPRGAYAAGLGSAHELPSPPSLGIWPVAGPHMPLNAPTAGGEPGLCGNALVS